MLTRHSPHVTRFVVRLLVLRNGTETLGCVLYVNAVQYEQFVQMGGQRFPEWSGLHASRRRASADFDNSYY